MSKKAVGESPTCSAGPVVPSISRLLEYELATRRHSTVTSTRAGIVISSSWRMPNKITKAELVLLLNPCFFRLHIFSLACPRLLTLYRPKSHAVALLESHQKKSAWLWLWIWERKWKWLNVHNVLVLWDNMFKWLVGQKIWLKGKVPQVTERFGKLYGEIIVLTKTKV